jgi:uncharacterized Fe-S cluster protein YjdI
MIEMIKEYSNGEITIVWKPDLCTHAAYCWEQLPQVFDPQKSPWVEPRGATTEQIIEQVGKCPSGALSYYMNAAARDQEVLPPETIVEVKLHGPLLVKGNIIVRDHLGNEIRKEAATYFCRCGASRNKPYCDGSHKKFPFEG